jgi:hypothetical protein
VGLQIREFPSFPSFLPTMERGLHYSIVVEKLRKTGKANKLKHLKFFSKSENSGI